MYVLYEDSGSLKAERILSEADSSLQVESASGKRSKIKKNSVVFTFDAPAPADMLSLADALAPTLDIPFLWECAPQREFSVEEFGAEYFGHAPSAVEKTALLMACSSAPAYFHRAGRGRYKPAPPDILAAALAALEKKARLAAQQQAWTDALLAGQVPDEIAAIADQLVTRPDKNGLPFKAVQAAAGERGASLERLLLDAGAWPHPLALRLRRFLATHFPHGTGFPEVSLPALPSDLPPAQAVAYSLDDDGTTEIDDALSVTLQEGDRARIGVHVAAPGLLVTRDDAVDALARARLSTVYIPGHKIPMMPTAVIEACSLVAGQPRPALSLYVEADLTTGEILGTETRLEMLTVAGNLSHGEIDHLATEAALDDPDAPLPYGEWLRPLWRFARHLCARREQVRGKPEGNSRVEYTFALDGPHDDPDSIIRLVPRQRNAPADRLVAEYMILANHLWGGLLAQHKLPGIYRSQQAGRVRMSTHALPHEAIGVPQYAWSTSPLRRYVDLVNQWQIIAVAQHGVSAALVAPFKPRDADMFAIISAFESQYALWGDFQYDMERYWCLRWLRQQGVRQIEAAVLREDLVRMEGVPLVTRVGGLPTLPRGARVRLDVLDIDELTLSVECRLLTVLDEAPADLPAADDETGDEAAADTEAPDGATGDTPAATSPDDATIPGSAA